MATVHLQRGITKNHIQAKCQKENQMTPKIRIACLINEIMNSECICEIVNRTNLMNDIKEDLGEDKFNKFMHYMRKLRGKNRDENHSGPNCHYPVDFISSLLTFK